MHVHLAQDNKVWFVVRWCDTKLMQWCWPQDLCERSAASSKQIAHQLVNRSEEVEGFTSNGLVADSVNMLSLCLRFWWVWIPFLEDFTLPHIFQVDSTRVQVIFQSPFSRVHLESRCIFFGWEHSQIGMHNPPGFHQDSRQTPDEPHGVSGVHFPDGRVDSTWTQSRVNPPGVQGESV